MMRYRATIYVDYFEDSGSVVEKKLSKLLSRIPNSFSDGFIPLKHGSEISIVKENPPKSDSFISKRGRG